MGGEVGLLQPPRGAAWLLGHFPSGTLISGNAGDANVYTKDNRIDDDMYRQHVSTCSLMGGTRRYKFTLYVLDLNLASMRVGLE